MKIVRARLKSLEELEVILKCCDKWWNDDIYFELRDKVVTVDLDSVHSHGYRCIYCGKEGVGKVVNLVPPLMLGGMMRQGVILELYDLDEGSC
jgi:hypothetical protein